jgi:hypothetical protein
MEPIPDREGPAVDASPIKPKPRPPRPRPKPRLLTVLEPAAPDTDGYFAIRLTVGKEAADYLIRQIHSDLPGRAFEIEKLDSKLRTVEVYHVIVGQPRDCSCECRGFLRWNRCKHIAGLLALDAAGRLPQVPRKMKYAACPRCLERCDGGQLCERCADDEAEFAAYHQADEMEAGGIDPFADTDPSELPMI